MSSFTVVFVCQAGELEVKAMLLAASLRRHLRGAFELVAAVPSPADVWGEPAPSTLRQLGRCGARVVPVENPFGLAYPIGNKMAALGVPSKADRILLLDSDVLALRPLDLDVSFRGRFAAAPADLRTATAPDALWETLYRRFGLEPPVLRVRTSVSGELMFPYVNAGVVAVDRAAGLCDLWLDSARRIDAMEDVPDRRPHLDQIALPIAVVRAGLGFESLPAALNFPAHLRPLPTSDPPLLVHYHSPEALRSDTACVRLVERLAAEDDDLKTALSADPRWLPALRRPSRARASSTGRSLLGALRRRVAARTGPHPELILTGLPRSGTSYFCRLLHTLDDVVAINEPQNVFEILAREPTPWSLARYFREVRRDVVEGRPIDNILLEGKLVDDTLTFQERATYCPPVSRTDFVLGMKNTRAFLSRLQDLRRAMPDAVVVACVRNPVDTLDSWKRSFDSLRDPARHPPPVGHADDPRLDLEGRRRMADVRGAAHPAVARALLWDHLARLVLQSREGLIVVRYEEFVRDPRPDLRRILQRFGRTLHARESRRFRASEPRSARLALDAADVASIRTICAPAAAELGVWEGA